jgi:hypothetical protein
MCVIHPCQSLTVISSFLFYLVILPFYHVILPSFLPCHSLPLHSSFCSDFAPSHPSCPQLCMYMYSIYLPPSYNSSRYCTDDLYVCSQLLHCNRSQSACFFFFKFFHRHFLEDGLFLSAIALQWFCRWFFFS